MWDLSTEVKYFTLTIVKINCESILKKIIKNLTVK